MSREIRFRVWDKKTNCYDDFNGIKIGENGVVFDKDYDWQEEIWYDKPDKEHNFVIEQFTGLKDKNGKEIYEGDIIKCYSQDTYPIGRVMYLEEYAEYEIVAYDKDSLSVYSLETFSPIKNKYLEIIGNIHENPELLEGGLK